MRGRPYPEIASIVLRKFTRGTFPEDAVDAMCRQAYNFEVPLEKVDSQKHIMRLDHGPTASFKDFAGRT